MRPLVLTRRAALTAPSMLLEMFAFSPEHTPLAGVRPQIVTNKGILPCGAGPHGYTLTESRTMVRNGWRPCREIRLILAGFTVSSFGAGEQPLPNPLTVEAALETLAPADRAERVRFDGQPGAVIAPGAGLLLSDPVALDVAANDGFKVQLGHRIAGIDGTLPTGSWFVGDGYRSVLATSQIGTAGAWTARDRQDSANVGTVTAVIGLPDRNYPSVAILGDSNLQGRDDDTGDAAGNHGHVPRALYLSGPGGTCMPHTQMSRSGERASTIANGGATFRLRLLQYVSHVITNYGTNDLVAGATCAQVTDALAQGWSMMKAHGVRVFQQLIVPKTSSSDRWATAAGQTFHSGYDPGGVRDRVNAWIRWQAGRLIDGIIDCNLALEDPRNPGCWLTNGKPESVTADGLHANALGHALCVPVVQAVARTFTLSADNR